MADSNVITIRNRPFEHYLLTIFSVLLRGEKEVILRSCGSVNGKAIDIANFVTNEVFPDIFKTDIKNSIDERKDVKVSSIEIHLKAKSDGD